MNEQISISHSGIVHMGNGGKAGFASHGHLRCRQMDVSLSQHDAWEREPSLMPHLQWLGAEVKGLLHLAKSQNLVKVPPMEEELRLRNR